MIRWCKNTDGIGFEQAHCDKACIEQCPRIRIRANRFMEPVNHLNLISEVALLAWPIVAIYLFATLPVRRAVLWTILGGYLLLPVASEIKIQMIPALDKTSIPNLAAFVGCMIVLRRPIRVFRRIGLPEILILSFLISIVITAQTNGDDIFNGTRIQGVGFYDAGSAILAQIIVFLPFFIGRELLCNEGDTEEILRVLIIAGLAYSLPILFETKMSAVLHSWIYGYFPAPNFGNEVRGDGLGGFRPVVFLGNGLLMSFFIMTSAVAATAFWRTGTPVMRKIRVPAAAITAYLSVLLVLCKSLGSLAYGVVLMPLVRFISPKLQMKVAVLLVSYALLYPMLRSADLVPTDAILYIAGSISTDRRDSLANRFKVENQLLERASQRFLFGWGRWGRSLIFDRYGQIATHPDGLWVITIGESGFIGFLTLFGLLALPVLRAASALGLCSAPKEKVLMAALILILAINIFDLIPNSPLRPWTWLIAGALLGRAEMLRVSARQRKKAAVANLSPLTNA
jgi:hypothetical protein